MFSGPSTLSPYRPEEDGQDLQTCHQEHVRERDAGQGGTQARPRQGCPPEHEHQPGWQGRTGTINSRKLFYRLNR